MLRENSLCVASLHFVAKLPPSLEFLLFHVFIGPNPTEPLCTPAWNSVAETITRSRFPSLRKFRFDLVLFKDNARWKDVLTEVENTVKMSFPESIRGCLEFGGLLVR